MVLDLISAMVDSVSVRFKKRERVEKMPLNSLIQWNAGTSLRVGVRAKNAVARRGLRVGPSKPHSLHGIPRLDGHSVPFQGYIGVLQCSPSEINPGVLGSRIGDLCLIALTSRN